MSGLSLIFIGAGMVIVGLLLSGGRLEKGPRIGNTGLSIFGSVTQTIHSVRMAISGERRKRYRDWIGWGISAAGLVIGLIGISRI